MSSQSRQTTTLISSAATPHPTLALIRPISPTSARPSLKQALGPDVSFQMQPSCQQPQRVSDAIGQQRTRRPIPAPDDTSSEIEHFSPASWTISHYSTNAGGSPESLHCRPRPLALRTTGDPHFATPGGSLCCSTLRSRSRIPRHVPREPPPSGNSCRDRPRSARKCQQTTLRPGTSAPSQDYPHRGRLSPRHLHAQVVRHPESPAQHPLAYPGHWTLSLAGPTCRQPSPHLQIGRHQHLHAG